MPILFSDNNDSKDTDRTDGSAAAAVDTTAVAPAAALSASGGSYGGGGGGGDGDEDSSRSPEYSLAAYVIAGLRAHMMDGEEGVLRGDVVAKTAIGIITPSRYDLS